MMAPPDQNREFPFFKITAKRTMSQENDHDFRDQHKILVLEMLTNPCGGVGHQTFVAQCNKSNMYIVNHLTCIYNKGITDYDEWCLSIILKCKIDTIY